ncbi:hypothetical protein BaRGS_00016480, partial [Batillaria attramentaria]
MQVLIFLALMIASACAQATTEDPIQADFDLLDKNGDNVATMDELYAYFDQFDANNDSKVTEHEFAAVEGGTGQGALDAAEKAVFDYFDRLGGAEDGEVLRTEVKIMMIRLDSNGNEKISPQEFATQWGK